MNKNLYIYPPFILLMLSGMDWPSFNYMNINIRISWIILLLLLIFKFLNIYITKKSLLFILLFIISFIPSIFLSVAINKSIFYLVWIFFNYIIFYCVSYYYVKKDIIKFVEAIILFSNVNIIICFLFYLIGYQERPSAFFYEPSYLSIALIPFCCIILVKNSYYKSKLTDYIMLFVYVLISQSAVVLFSIIFAILFNYSLSLKKIFYVFISFIFIFLYLLFINDINTIYIKDLINNLSSIDLNQFLSRGGNRFPRLLSTYDTALNNYFFGIGLGSYDIYSSLYDIDRIEYNNEYLSGKGLPGVNIWLEVFASGGFFAFLIFSLLTIFIFFKIIKSDSNLRVKLAIFTITFLIMMIESTFLRGYLWCFIPFLLYKNKPL